MTEAMLPIINLAGDFAIKAGWTLDYRTIADYELSYLPERSRTEYMAGGATYTAEEPCFIITRPLEAHSYKFDPVHATRILFFHFDFGSLPAPVEQFAFLRPGGPARLPASEISLVPKLLKHILQLSGESCPSRDRHVRTLFLAVLEELQELAHPLPASGEPGGGMPPSILRALDYIDQNLSGPLSVRMLANRLGWSHEHFTRMFVKHVGRSPQQAILQRRIERACRLLLQNDRSIKEIAGEAGFDNSHYFSRVFVKMKGITASQYRLKYADPRLHHLSPADEYQASYPMNRYIVVRSIK